MSNIDSLILEIEEMLKDGFWPAEICARTGASMKMVIDIEDQVFTMTEEDSIIFDYSSDGFIS